MFSRFDTIQACDGQTDGQTSVRLTHVKNPTHRTVERTRGDNGVFHSLSGDFVSPRDCDMAINLP